MSQQPAERHARALASSFVITLLCGVLAMLGYTAPADAATAFAASTVDWSSLTVLHLDGGSVAFDNAGRGTLFDESLANAGGVGASQHSLGWDAGSFATVLDTAGANHAVAIALTPATGADSWLHKHLYAESSVASVTPGSGSASAHTVREGRFTVSGDGRVVLQLDYDLFVAAHGNDFQGKAQGKASVVLNLLNLSHPEAAPYTASKTLATLFDGTDSLDGERARVNALRVGLIFHSGDVGLLRVTLASSAAASTVPLPAGAGLAIMPLAVLARRRRRPGARRPARPV